MSTQLSDNKPKQEEVDCLSDELRKAHDRFKQVLGVDDSRECTTDG